MGQEKEINNTQDYMFYNTDANKEVVDDDMKFDKSDILAFIIAAFQVIMPVVFLLIGAYGLVMMFFQFVWFR